jgi:hypothetical protein
MNVVKGYYSLIQYCPDLSRLEAVNVGVLLFCPEPHFLTARTTDSIKRIRRFFGSEDGDFQQIKAEVSAVEDRLTTAGDHIHTTQELDRFIATRGNAVQLTPPRPMKVVHPVQDLEALFQRLVGGKAGPRRQGGQSLALKLKEVLTEQSVAPFIKTEVPVAVPTLHETLTMPFGFQNGRFNLIQPVSEHYQSGVPARRHGPFPARTPGLTVGAASAMGCRRLRSRSGGGESGSARHPGRKRGSSLYRGGPSPACGRDSHYG